MTRFRTLTSYAAAFAVAAWSAGMMVAATAVPTVASMTHVVA